ncbi:hypothetical protein PUN28_000001 [Cardiocondyla obscurior]|uniref:Reverse transcriptase n=1 Tax=Cardiocondyla obscurior TaxID=286306 RepID=A0AAW2E900_9HYME
MDRQGWKGVLSFWTSQIITGHGCFASYLHRIGKETSAICHHCDDDAVDHAQHTLAVCPAWAVERQALIDVAGQDLSLPSIMKNAVESEEVWLAFMQFCNAVMQQKEDSEREREHQAQAIDAPVRRRNRGRTQDHHASVQAAQTSTRVLRPRPTTGGLSRHSSSVSPSRTQR